MPVAMKADTSAMEVPQASLALAKTETFESPTSVADPFPTSLRQAFVSQADPLPLVNSSEVQSPPDNTSNETTWSPKRCSPPADHDATVAGDFSHGNTKHQAPPPKKKVRFADNPVSQVESATRSRRVSISPVSQHGGATPDDAIEESAVFETPSKVESQASAHPKNKQANEDSRASKTCEVPLESVTYHCDAGFVEDGTNETDEVCTQTIRVPWFADSYLVRGKN